jgi:glutaminase
MSGTPIFVSTGTLPTPEEVRAVVEDAYERFRHDDNGTVADYIPAPRLG